MCNKNTITRSIQKYTEIFAILVVIIIIYKSYFKCPFYRYNYNEK